MQSSAKQAPPAPEAVIGVAEQSRTEEAMEVAQDYANQQRELLKRLRRLLN